MNYNIKTKSILSKTGWITFIGFSDYFKNNGEFFIFYFFIKKDTEFEDWSIMIDPKNVYRHKKMHINIFIASLKIYKKLFKLLFLLNLQENENKIWKLDF